MYYYNIYKIVKIVNEIDEFVKEYSLADIINQCYISYCL